MASAEVGTERVERCDMLSRMLMCVYVQRVCNWMNEPTTAGVADFEGLLIMWEREGDTKPVVGWYER